MRACAGFNESAPLSGSFQNLTQKLNQKLSLNQAFASLSAAEQGEIRAKVGAKNLDEILSIAGNGSAEGFWQDALALGVRLKSNDQIAAAGGVLSLLSQGEAVPQAVKTKATAELDAIVGKGAGNLRAEFLVGQFAKQATDWRVIAPMVAGSAVFSLTRTAVLSRLAASSEIGVFTRGFGARFLSGVIGTAAEVPVFSLGSRTLVSLTDGGVSWDATSVGKDLAGAALTLGALKIFGFAGNQGFMKFHGVGELGAATRFTGFSRYSQGAFAQGSMFAGMMLAHKLEESAGLRAKVDGATTVMDSLSAQIALAVGAHLGHKALGTDFARFQQEVELRAKGYGDALSGRPRSGDSPLAWLSTMMSGPKLAPAGEASLSMSRPAEGPKGPPILKMSSLDPENGVGSTSGIRSEMHAEGTRVIPADALKGRYVVVANRGEPAVRAVKEAQDLGATAVIMHSDADQHSLHANMDGVIALRLPGDTSDVTYLNVPLRLALVEQLMQDHGLTPDRLLQWEGWGFKSEDPENAAELEKRGIKLAGAQSYLMRQMGDKVSAREVAQRAGVPVVPGSKGSVTLSEAKEFAKEAGYPVILKGKDTGGGKGIREVWSEDQMEAQYESAANEAKKTSGSDALFIEKFIVSMRHLEVQVIGDGKGQFEILSIRDCTKQRKKQKVLEEDVGTFLDPDLYGKGVDIGKRIMMQLRQEDPRGIGYEGPGTIELIWDQADNKLYFMEMNTRIQVEHTVTEMVTRTNILKYQLLIGAGYTLDRLPAIPAPQGHAIEARITSENPYDNFLPSAGKILHMRTPSAPKEGRAIVRVDSGVEEGREIPQFYDSMIAKLIVWAPTRPEAVRALQKALNEFEILGPKTNIAFLQSLAASPEFEAGKGYDTKFIENIFLNSEAGKPSVKHMDEALIAAAVQTYRARADRNPLVELKFDKAAHAFQVYEVSPGRYWVKSGEVLTEVGLSSTKDNLFTLEINGVKRRALILSEAGKRDVQIGNVSYEIAVDGEGSLGPEFVVSASAAAVMKLLKSVGDPVAAGEDVAVTEAMKMESRLQAEVSGVVEEIFVKPGSPLEPGMPLMKIRAAGAAAEASGSQAAASPPLRVQSGALGRLLAATEITPAQRREAMTWFERYFEGFSGPETELIEVLAKLEPTAELGEAYRKEVDRWLQGLLLRYQVVESVYQPAFNRPLQYFLKSGKAEDAVLSNLLENALNLYGVTSLKPSPARDAAMARIRNSHEQQVVKQKFLSKVLPWISKYDMGGLEAPLSGVSQVYAEKAQAPFYTLVEATLALLRDHKIGTSYGPMLESEYHQATGPNRKNRAKALRRLIQRPEMIMPFLLRKARSHGRKEALHALRIIQQRLYRNNFAVSSQTDYPSDRIVVGLLESKSPVRTNSNWIVHQRISRFGEMEAALPRAVENMQRSSARRGVGGDWNLEIILGETPAAEEWAQMPRVLDAQLGDPSLKRVTVILEDTEAGEVDYRTFERDPAGGFRENLILRDVHPMHAHEIGLMRWTPNFDLERSDFGLFNNVHAYRAIQKGRRPEDSSADRQHFVIGEHASVIEPRKFNGNIARNQLIQDFQKIRANASYEVASENRIFWQWLPYALKVSGQVGPDFDPFTVDILRASPRELISRFRLDEMKLNKAGAVYEGKVYSVPEIERTARNTALVLKRLQESGESDKRIRTKLPALADIYIRHPVDVSDDEIRLLAFRLTPPFMGNQIQKTTVHFRRRQPSGHLQSFIAEIKIPRGSRFEVNIKPVIEAPPHSVKSPLEHKRAQQQGRGKLYVYDRVGLFHDVIKDFYPEGNIPPDAVRVQELVMDGKGGLTPTDRGPGENNIGKVAFHVTLKLPKGANAADHYLRTFAIIADDFTYAAGSQGTKEGDIYAALSRYAEEHGIPKLYLAETSGARLGLAEEVTPFVHRDTDRSSNYILEGDLAKPVGKKQKPLSELVVVGEPYAVETLDGETPVSELRYPIQAILGEGEINTESLNASGKTGESESRARQSIPTFTIAMGTVIGIGTYDTKLSERVIMVGDSFLGLTGRKAINQTFGTTFTSELEVAGPEIMQENGVAYKVVDNERDALKSFLQWISYFPAKRGEEGVRFEVSDPLERDITPGLLSGEAPIIRKGTAYDTRLFDRALFDNASVFYVKEGYGRAANTGYARLGGRPVGLISMQLAPEQIPGGEQIFGGALDASTSFKVAQHLENLNVEGLPVIFMASISGFMPRPDDHREGVVPGGAKILDKLREFNHPAMIYVPPFGQLWGGAWVVIDKNVNGNIVMGADRSAAMGILGSAGAISVPKNARSMEADLKQDPLLVALQAEIAGTPDKKARQVLLEKYQRESERLQAEVYLPKWREILDAQNTAERAFRKGTIHYRIEDAARTRPELYQKLEQKTAEIREAKAAREAEAATFQGILGALQLAGLEHQVLGSGEIEIRWQGRKVTFEPTGGVLAGIQGYFQTQGFQLIQEIIFKTGNGTKPGK